MAEEIPELAFELGFDLDVHPIQGVRDGVFPLQLALVNDGEDAVISPFDPSKVRQDYRLSFRVYDFSYPAPGLPTPSLSALQILFTSATSVSVPMSPFTQPQLATTAFVGPDVESIAFGEKVRFGWEVQWTDDSGETVTDFRLERAGRFNFRALLTVGIPEEMAKFYRADPEMVVGDPAGLQRSAHSPPATVRR